MSADADRLAIRQLVQDYGITVDAADRAGLAELYAPDGTFVRPNGEAIEGRDQVVEFTVSVIEKFAITRHLVLNHRSVVDGDTASGVTYCTAHHLLRKDGGLVDLMLQITYDDSYVRNGSWRFQSRRITCNWAEVRPIASADVGDMSPFSTAIP